LQIWTERPLFAAFSAKRRTRGSSFSKPLGVAAAPPEPNHISASLHPADWQGNSTAQIRGGQKEREALRIRMHGLGYTKLEGNGGRRLVGMLSCFEMRGGVCRVQRAVG